MLLERIARHFTGDTTYFLIWFVSLAMSFGSLELLSQNLNLQSRKRTCNCNPSWKLLSLTLCTILKRHSLFISGCDQMVEAVKQFISVLDYGRTS